MKEGQALSVVVGQAPVQQLCIKVTRVLLDKMPDEEREYICARMVIHFITPVVMEFVGRVNGKLGEEKRKKMIERCRQAYGDRYSISEMADGAESAYEEDLELMNDAQLAEEFEIATGFEDIESSEEDFDDEEEENDGE
jgi:hypothetical protein